DAGYGFFAKLADLYSKNKAGKAVISIPEGAEVLAPQLISNPEEGMIVVVSNEGRLLVFPAKELPVLAKGKGNKMLGVPSNRVASREEYMIAAVPMQADDILMIYAGRRHLSLKMADLEHYIGERGRRGNKLPRGFQNVDRVEIQKRAEV